MPYCHFLSTRQSACFIGYIKHPYDNPPSTSRFFWQGQKDFLLTSATVHRTVAAKASRLLVAHPWSSFQALLQHSYPKQRTTHRVVLCFGRGYKKRYFSWVDTRIRTQTGVIELLSVSHILSVRFLLLFLIKRKLHKL